MKYIKRFKEINESKSSLHSKFEDLVGSVLKVLKYDKIPTDNGYLLNYDDKTVVELILKDDEILLKSVEFDKEYQFNTEGCSLLLNDLTLILYKYRKEHSLISKKHDILNDFIKLNIPDHVISEELGQNDKSTVVNFIERGHPSEYYLRKILKLIKKFS